MSVVENGAALLDIENPGWYKKINLDKLSINSCSDCILGQIYGDYWAGASIIQRNPNYTGVYNLGFAIPMPAFATVVLAAEYVVDKNAKLNAEWKKQIQARLEMDTMEKEIQKEEELVCV